MRRHRESGQAAVETAIIMPFFVFFILGLLQLMLLHQGRLMVKYAAYKATRAGSIQRVNKGAMKNAALAVLLPLLTRTNGETLFKLDGPGNYTLAWQQSRFNLYTSGVSMVDVTVCNPLSGQTNDKVDFDSPVSVTDGSGNMDWQSMDRTRLATQVTFMQPMVIPFANGILWYIMVGPNYWAAGGNVKDTMYTLRLKNRGSSGSEGSPPDSTVNVMYAAQQGRYYAPIRGNWTMRLMTNVLPNSLPSKNECKVPKL